jgi:plasmid stability protein
MISLLSEGWIDYMAAITVRNLPDETLRALKVRAAKVGRSTEAEIREILANAVRSPMGIGSALADIGRRSGGVDLDVTRRRGTLKPADFE